MAPSPNPPVSRRTITILSAALVLLLAALGFTTWQWWLMRAHGDQVQHRLGELKETLQAAQRRRQQEPEERQESLSTARRAEQKAQAFERQLADLGRDHHQALEHAEHSLNAAQRQNERLGRELDAARERAEIAERRNARLAASLAEADAQVRWTLARQLTARSRLAGALPLPSKTDYPLALLLGVASVQIEDNPRTRGNLAELLRHHPHREAELVEHTDAVLSIAFSPDARLLASGGQDRRILLWDVASRTVSGRPFAGLRDAVRSVAFSPDGHTLAGGVRDGTIVLWDVRAQDALEEPLRARHGSVSRIAFDPKGKLLSSAHGNGGVMLWDVLRRKAHDYLEGHREPVWTLAFSHDGRMLASGSWDATVVLWDLARSKALGKPLRGHTD